mgnify:CR=1 FL=1
MGNLRYFKYDALKLPSLYVLNEIKNFLNKEFYIRHVNAIVEISYTSLNLAQLGLYKMNKNFNAGNIISINIINITGFLKC